jgi:hypothetical protein
MEHGLHLPAALPVCACGGDRALGATVTRRAIVASPGRDRAQPARAQRQAPRMARKVAGSGRLRFALLLLGFV